MTRHCGDFCTWSAAKTSLITSSAALDEPLKTPEKPHLQASVTLGREGASDARVPGAISLLTALLG